MNPIVTFLHFSDIHFNKQANSIYCLDRDLRNEMVIDIEEVVNKEHLHTYGIIICGDIAYSGQIGEYEIADEFINELVNKLKIEIGHVFCVPGNHDVDQSVAKNSLPIYAVQKLLEESDDNMFQNYLDKLRIEAIKNQDDILYRPLENYNNFSGKYMGNVSSKEAPWTHEINLDKEYVLCLYGINSTIISNADDHLDTKTSRMMRIGKHQIPMRREKVIYMTICHHPTDDWKEEVSQVLDERAMIQLYGHKHVQTLDKNSKRIKIGTGALQPDRKDINWQPRYNFLSVERNKNDLEVTLYPRIWNDSIHKFVQDDMLCDLGYNYKKIFLPLVSEAATQNEDSDKGCCQRVRETSDCIRKLVYELWRHQAYDREKIMREYEVFKDISFDNLNQNIEKILEIAERNKLVENIIARFEAIGESKEEY